MRLLLYDIGNNKSLSWYKKNELYEFEILKQLKFDGNQQKYE